MPNADIRMTTQIRNSNLRFLCATRGSKAHADCVETQAPLSHQSNGTFRDAVEQIANQFSPPDFRRLAQSGATGRNFSVFRAPGGGEYRYDPATDSVHSTVQGNCQDARQPLNVEEDTALARLLDTINEIAAAFAFTNNGLVGTVEINRGGE
jgi:hypothetical protein